MKKLLTFVLLMPFYLSAADFGVGYSHFNIDLGDGDSVGLGTVTAAIGARSEDGFFSGEIGVYVPVAEEVLNGVNVELKTGPYVRAFIHFSENFFVSAGAMKIEAEACYRGTCISETSTEGAFGLGASFPIVGTGSELRIMYEQVDDADVISVSSKYEF